MDLFADLKSAWENHRIFRNTNVPKNLEKHLDRLIKIIPIGLLLDLLPSASIRPVLAAAVIEELSSFYPLDSKISRDHLLAHSSILYFTSLSYQPLLVEDVCSKLPKKIDKDFDLEGSLRKILLGFPGINSTFRNLLLAAQLNKTILKHTKYQASIALAQYDWEEHNASSSIYAAPELPEGSLRNKYTKVIIAIAQKDATPIYYFDYGQKEGEEHYGFKASGEGFLNVIGSPVPHELLDPSSMEDVSFLLKTIETSQSRSGEREAVRRMALHRQMIKDIFDYVETPNGLYFPNIFTKIDDLNEDQLRSVLHWSSLIEQLSTTTVSVSRSHELRLGSGMVYTPLKSCHARIESNRASAKNLTPALEAMRSLGIQSEISQLSSRTKGEGYISDAFVLSVHNVDVVLRRDEKIEVDLEEVKHQGDQAPAFISLGGSEHHPTQTLADIKTLMDYFACTEYSIESLHNLTLSKPPHITFIGKTNKKRSDRDLIAFIFTYLKHWHVKVLVNDHDDQPKMKIPPGVNYDVQVVRNLTDQAELKKQLRQTDLVYISNAGPTFKVETRVEGESEKASHYLSLKLIQELDLKVMHPLPASDELDADIFRDSNSLIATQMKNKIYVIAALVAHQLHAKESRRIKHDLNKNS